MALVGEPSDWIRTRGLGYYDRAHLLSLGVGGFLIAGFMVLLLPPSALAWLLVVDVIIVTANFIFLESRWATRAVRVSDRDVSFRFLFRTVTVPWEQLGLDADYQVLAKKQRGVYIVRAAWASPNRERTTYFATFEQARSILAHPRAAGWPVPPEVAALVRGAVS